MSGINYNGLLPKYNVTAATKLEVLAQREVHGAVFLLVSAMLAVLTGEFFNSLDLLRQCKELAEVARVIRGDSHHNKLFPKRSLELLV